MFVVVEENHGVIYVTGPFIDRRDARAHILSRLKELVEYWGEPYSMMTDEELMREFNTRPIELFTDTDVQLLICEMTAP